MDKKNNEIPQKNCILCGKGYSKDRLISKKQWINSKFCSRGCHYKWRVGKSSPHKRRKMTEEEKIERRKNPNAWAGFTKGIKLTEEHKQKLSLAKRKDGTTIFDGYKTPENKRERLRFKNEVQKLVLERDSYTCQMCNKKGVVLHVDHIQPWSEYIKLRFDINNCRTLCVDCHYFITFGKKKPRNISWGNYFKRKSK
jgi:5-methylcytosine-specific restriction endonuclease McrA